MSILTNKVTITIDKKTFDDYDFSDVQLVQELQKPNTLRFIMQKKSLLTTADEIRFSLSQELLGKPIEFSVESHMYNKKREVENHTLTFTGIIFTANLIRNNLRSRAVIEVIAHSPDYLLYDDPHCFSWENKKLKEIVEATLDPYKIDIKNNPRLEEEIPYTVQYNENNYAFLSRLSSRYGEWFFYNGTELIFGKLDEGEKITMSLGSGLINYQYSLDMEHLGCNHAHYNYMPQKRMWGDAEDIGVPDSSKHNMTDIVYEKSKALYNKNTRQHLQCSSPEYGLAEINIALKVERTGKKAQMMVCSGESNHANLKIGSIITIQENYEEKQGTEDTCTHDDLLVCRVVHKVDSMGNYENSFTAIPADCEHPPYIYGDHFPKSAPQRAQVEENNDPDKLGRVRVKFSWQQLLEEESDNHISPWIRIAMPHAGYSRGFYFMPEIGDEVMVGFEHGSVEKPYVIGALYRITDDEYSDAYGFAESNGDDTNQRKYIRTKNGHTMRFLDEEKEGEGGIRFYNALTDDNPISYTYDIIFDVEKKLVRIKSKGNIELQAGSNIIMKAGKGILMEAKEESITMRAKENITRNADQISDYATTNAYIMADEALHTSVKDHYVTVNGDEHHIVEKDQNINISGKKDEEVGGKCKLSASDIETKAQNSMKLSSVQHEQKASAQMKIDGGPMLDVKGSMVKIN